MRNTVNSVTEMKELVHFMKLTKCGKTGMITRIEQGRNAGNAERRPCSARTERIVPPPGRVPPEGEKTHRSAVWRYLLGPYSKSNGIKSRG